MEFNKNNILLVLFILLFQNAYSQNGAFNELVLSNENTGEEIYISEGEEVKIITNDDLTFLEPFRIKNDSTLIVDNNEFSLDNINDIKFLEPHKKFPVAFFLGLGALSIVTGAIIGANNEPEPGLIGLGASLGKAALGGTLLISGGIMTGIGTGILIINRNHKKSKGWTYNVR